MLHYVSCSMVTHLSNLECPRYGTFRRVPEVQPLSNNFLPRFLNLVGGTGQYRAKFASVERLLTYTWNITQITFPT